MSAKAQYCDILPGTCGIGVFNEFEKPYNTSWSNNRNTHIPPAGGCGWNIAGFINRTECYEVYEDFKKMYKIVMQSPVRRNNNSGHQFFFVMYDCKKPRRSKKNPEALYDLSGNDQYKWPWKS